MALDVRTATAADAAACVEVYRPYVLDTPITFETEVPTVQDIADRIDTSHEWLILEDDGTVLGYAYATRFHPRSAYRWAVETSVYMARDRHGSGGGRTLYTELLKRLAGRGFRRAFACIAQPNEASNGFHQRFGFQPVGYFRRVGWKLDTWHDVQWWQLDLLDPSDETDPPPEVGASRRKST